MIKHVYPYTHLMLFFKIPRVFSMSNKVATWILMIAVNNIAGGLCFDEFIGRSNSSFSSHQVTTYFNSISQERLQQKERGRFIAATLVSQKGFVRLANVC